MKILQNRGLAENLVLTEDYPVHRAMMRAYTATVESEQKRDWLAGIESLASFAGAGSGTSMKPAAYFHVGAVADGRDDRPD